MSDWVVVQHAPVDTSRGKSWPQQSFLDDRKNFTEPWSRQNSHESNRSHSLSFDEQILLPNAEVYHEDEAKHIEITKKHWKSKDNCTACRNRKCRKKFSLIERQHHCRRCGEIFCSSCVKFQRNLNKLANPDPEGKKFKVCQSCFDEGRDNEGSRRKLTDEFIWLRKHCKEEKLKRKFGNVPTTLSWRDKVDLDVECKRLCDGFKTSIGTSEMKRTLQEMSTVITTPDWHKSTFWLTANMAENCQSCMSGFGLMKKKHNCKVCGTVLCKACSTKELLVYLPDDRDNDLPAEPQLAIIKIVGCPAVEPEISLSLRVCSMCKENLIGRQVALYHSNDEVSSTVDVMSRLVSLEENFRKIQSKIDTLLYEFQDIVESLEDDKRGCDSSGDSRNNMKILAKSQEDISDYFSQLVLKIQQLKRVTPETDTQSVLTKNLLKSKSMYYLDNMYTFRRLKHKLGEAAPPEVLEYIQRTVDKNAIVSTQLYVRQLLFETLHLSDRYKLKEDFPQVFTPLDEVIEREASVCLSRCGEDLDQHTSDLSTMTKRQLKEHRLIRPSKRLLNEQGHRHAADVTLKRTKETLEQVKIQLCMKSINKSFSGTKTKLDEVISVLKTMDIKTKD